MIASNFVSCYRCAGEGSDRSCGSVSGAGFWADHQASSKQSRSQKLEAQVLYSLIDFFLIYTAVTFIIQSRGLVLVAGMREAGESEADGCKMEEKTEWSSVNLTASSWVGEKEGCDTCKQMKHRNDENRSAGRSLDCCSSKLLEFNHVCVWAVTAGCNAPVRHHRSPPGPGSVHGLPQTKLLQTDHRPPPQCKVLCCLSHNFRLSLGIFITYKTCRDILMKTKMTANVLITWKTKHPPPKKNQNKKQWKIKVWEQYCTESYKTPRLCPQWENSVQQKTTQGYSVSDLKWLLMYKGENYHFLRPSHPQT